MKNLIKLLLRESINLNVSKQLRNDWNVSALDDVFGKNIYRLYYDLNTGKQITPTKKNPKLKFDVEKKNDLLNNINLVINDNGFSIMDFEKNIGVNNKTNQKINISKILNNFDKDLFNDYNLYLDKLSRNNDNTINKLYVVVSRHPHDLASKSAKPRISSCEDIRDFTDISQDYSGWNVDLDKAAHSEGGAGNIRDAIINNGIIFYLIEDGDWNIQDPIARQNHDKLCTGSEIKMPSSTYGNYNITFAKFVEQWGKTYSKNVHNEEPFNIDSLSDMNIREILDMIRQLPIESKSPEKITIFRGLIIKNRYDVIEDYIDVSGVDNFINQTKDIYGDKIYKNFPERLKDVISKKYSGECGHFIHVLKQIYYIKTKQYNKIKGYNNDNAFMETMAEVLLSNLANSDVIRDDDFNRFLKIFDINGYNELNRLLSNNYIKNIYDEINN